MPYRFPTTESGRPDAARLDECLARLAEGDAAALETLHAEAGAAVYSYALSVLKDSHDAQDALHDCFLQVWSAAPGYRSSGKPMAWIVTIARNLCLMRLRERGRSDRLPPEEWALLPETASRMTHEERLTLTACMERLSDVERQIVALHAVSGFRHREIAALLSLPLATVLSKYARALRKLKHDYTEGEPL